jgi:hypothetical protein
MPKRGAGSGCRCHCTGTFRRTRGPGREQVRGAVRCGSAVEDGSEGLPSAPLALIDIRGTAGTPPKGPLCDDAPPWESSDGFDPLAAWDGADEPGLTSP